MNGLAEHSSVCFIGNPFSVYFSTRCTAFTAAGASESRPCASTRIKPEIDGLRLVGGNPDFTNAPGHGDDDARFYDRQQAYVHARGG